MGIAVIVDAVARELTLFAAAGLLAGGVDDLVIDLIFLARWLMRRGERDAPLTALPVAARPYRSMTQAYDSSVDPDSRLDQPGIISIGQGGDKHEPEPITIRNFSYSGHRCYLAGVWQRQLN